jgi:hypothetical protein
MYSSISISRNVSQSHKRKAFNSSESHMRDKSILYNGKKTYRKINAFRFLIKKKYNEFNFDNIQR